MDADIERILFDHTTYLPDRISRVSQFRSKHLGA